MPGFLTNCYFLAIVSMLSTAILIVLSGEAFGKIHPSLIMLLRVIGVISIVGPVVVYVSSKGTSGLTWQAISKNNVLLWIAIAAAAGVSWYSFYLALDYGKRSGVSLGTIAAINYASAGLVLIAEWIMRRQEFNLRNLAGMVLLLVGLLLVSTTAPKDTSATPPASPQQN